MSIDFYSAPSNMAGGYIVYKGSRRQRGAGIFGSFRKFLVPAGRQALSGIKKLASNKTVQNIAKKAAETGAEVLTGVAVDALQGRNIGESFKERGQQAAMNALAGTSSSPLPRRRRRHKQVKKKLKQTRKRLPSSKQLAGQGGPPTKKRRTISRAALNRKQLF